MNKVMYAVMLKEMEDIINYRPWDHEEPGVYFDSLWSAPNDALKRLEKVLSPENEERFSEDGYVLVIMIDVGMDDLSMLSHEDRCVGSFHNKAGIYRLRKKGIIP